MSEAPGLTQSRGTTQTATLHGSSFPTAGGEVTQGGEQTQPVYQGDALSYLTIDIEWRFA